MRLGIRECVDVVFKALSNTKIGSHTFKKGEPVIYFDSVTTSELTGESTTVYAQGGKGNPRRIAWEGEKNVTFSFTDALISPEGMAILTGADLIQAGSDSNTKVYGHNTSTIQITEAGKVTLAADDASIYTGNITEYPVYIMLLDDNGEMSGTPVKIESDAIADNVITSTLVKAGDIVMVDYYSEYSEDAIQIEITPDKFAGYFYIEGSTLYRRELDGVDVPAEIIIPKGKIQTSFTFTMAGTGDPSSFDFTVDAFPGYIKGSATQSLAAIQILGADDNYDQVGASDEETGEVTYARYDYNKDTEGSYLRPTDEPITYNDTTTQDDEELGD